MAADPTAAGPVATPAAARQPLPNPITVVGPQFYAQYPVDLIMVKKVMFMSAGNFTVTDVNGTVIFEVKRTHLSLRDHRVLLDAAGKPIVSLQSKIGSMHSRWQVFRGESTDPKDLLFSAKRSSMIQLKRELDVFLAANTREEVCDFKLKGSRFDKYCTVYAGNSNTIIAQMQMQKKHNIQSVVLGKDTFAVTVYPNVDYAFIVALIVILEDINRDKS